MSKQRQAHHRHPDCPPYPYIAPEIRAAMDQYLAYFEGRALTTWQRMRKIPKKERPDWYQNSLAYWRHAYGAYKLARKINNITANNNASTSQCSSETVDPSI